MRVLVCGGRNYHDLDTAHNLLDSLHRQERITVVIDGGASGADRLGFEWAHCNGVTTQTYAADWKKHGKAAGPIRNREMLDVGRPDLVLAFPGGRGTADMVRQAESRSVPVRKIESGY